MARRNVCGKKRERKETGGKIDTYVSINYKELHEECGVCEAGFSCRRYVISCAPLQNTTHRRKGPQKRILAEEEYEMGPSRAYFTPWHGTPLRTRRARGDATGRRSRLFRNDDAPASRIAEGLHCASATRVSSTQPPRSACGTAPVCTSTYLCGWLCGVRVHVCLYTYMCARATSSHSPVVYQTVSPTSAPQGSRHPFTPLPILRASLFSFFFLIFFYFFLFSLFFFCALFLFSLFPRVDLFPHHHSSLRFSFFLFFPVGTEENRGPGPIRTRKSANPVITYGRDN